MRKEETLSVFLSFKRVKERGRAATLLHVLVPFPGKRRHIAALVSGSYKRSIWYPVNALVIGLDLKKQNERLFGVQGLSV